jgi:hypothetical protein
LNVYRKADKEMSIPKIILQCCLPKKRSETKIKAELTDEGIVTP